MIYSWYILETSIDNVHIGFGPVSPPTGAHECHSIWLNGKQFAVDVVSSLEEAKVKVLESMKYSKKDIEHKISIFEGA